MTFLVVAVNRPIHAKTAKFVTPPSNPATQQKFHQKIHFFHRLGVHFTTYPYKLRQKSMGQIIRVLYHTCESFDVSHFSVGASS